MCSSPPPRREQDAARRATLLRKGMADVPSTPGHFFTCKRCAVHSNKQAVAEAAVPRVTPAAARPPAGTKLAGVQFN